MASRLLNCLNACVKMECTKCSLNGCRDCRTQLLRMAASAVEQADAMLDREREKQKAAYAQKQTYDRKYYVAHKQKINEAHRIWYSSHKEYMREYNKKYYQAHKAERLEYRRQCYELIKKGNGGNAEQTFGNTEETQGSV